ncbi:hypothetical protein J2S74_002863 [Evansella vedderi]|uniref:DUF4845 domain-containing protein n=1 Tax=Evansella vedderi TaxID=38282 RepID=A0ABT9ZW75_9BACI|nr:hypothetical protein [Evansella vedderi]MDQ0255481.1 hypothetical protein [Evansella vedderi]
MSSTLGKWMTAIIAIIVMFTPILAYLDSLHRNAVDTVLLEASKKAAIEGRFTEELKSEMVSELVNRYNFSESDIVLELTEDLTPRNQYIEGSIEVPRGPIFIIDIFNQGPSTIKRDVRILSEYVGS